MSKSDHHDALYNEAALLKQKEMFDMVRYDKAGKPRENQFVYSATRHSLKWCRRVAAIRENHSIATEHAEASEHDDPQWYNIWGKHA